ncbi:MAG: hypothetical protein OXU61_10580 [Gammaproteobacteria bacterium]|nr:hypothetical protein [Gammaproteobacteria bacterium]
MSGRRDDEDEQAEQGRDYAPAHGGAAKPSRCRAALARCRGERVAGAAMTQANMELLDALQDAGASDDKARAAAQ